MHAWIHEHNYYFLFLTFTAFYKIGIKVNRLIERIRNYNSIVMKHTLIDFILIIITSDFSKKECSCLH